MTVFTRRMGTDRVILGFTCLIVCGVVGIMIYTLVSPEQTEFTVPDQLKPPDPNNL